MTPTERAALRRQAERYAKAKDGSPEHRNLQALLAMGIARRGCIWSSSAESPAPALGRWKRLGPRACATSAKPLGSPSS